MHAVANTVICIVVTITYNAVVTIRIVVECFDTCFDTK